MNTEVEAADQVLRLTMDGFVYFFKVPAAILESGIKIFGMISNAVRENTAGSVLLKSIIKEGNGIATFSIPEKELEIFSRQSSTYKLKYSVIKPDKVDSDNPMVTIVVSGNNATVANAIIQTNKLHGRMLNDFRYAGKDKEAVMEKPVQQEAEFYANHPEQKPASEQTEVKSSAPVQEPDRPLTQEEVNQQNEDFLRNELGTDAAQTHKGEQPEVLEPDPTSAASRSGSLSERKSTESSAAGTYELDIEHLPSEIWPEDENGRISVRTAAKEAQEIIENRQNGIAAPSQKKEPAMLDSMIDKIEAQNQQLLAGASIVKGE